MAGGDDGETLPTADRTQGGSADWLVGPGGPPPTTASHESHRTSWGGTKALICWFAAPRARLTGFDVSCERRWIRFAPSHQPQLNLPRREQGPRSTEYWHAWQGVELSPGRSAVKSNKDNLCHDHWKDAIDVDAVGKEYRTTVETEYPIASNTCTRRQRGSPSR